MDKRDLYKTAKMVGVNCFVSLLRYDADFDRYLCRGPYKTMWIPADELEDFVL